MRFVRRAADVAVRGVKTLPPPPPSAERSAAGDVFLPCPAAAELCCYQFLPQGLATIRAARKLQGLELRNDLNPCAPEATSSGKEERFPPSCRKGQHFSLNTGDDLAGSLNGGAECAETLPLQFACLILLC